jgi:hypothetical protein
METVKANFSMTKSLIERIEALANEMDISRSHLLMIALEDFFRSYENRQLLEQINRAYEDGPDDEEQKWLMYAPADYWRKMHGDQSGRRVLDRAWQSYRLRILDGIRLLIEPREVKDTN